MNKFSYKLEYEKLKQKRLGEGQKGVTPPFFNKRKEKPWLLTTNEHLLELPIKPVKSTSRRKSKEGERDYEQSHKRKDKLMVIISFINY